MEDTARWMNGYSPKLISKEVKVLNSHCCAGLNPSYANIYFVSEIEQANRLSKPFFFPSCFGFTIMVKLK